MKKLLLPVFILLFVTGFSQPYTNSWIDYNKTYYKFKIAASGVYRISQPSLTPIGLANTPAEQFQLWKNGKQVTLYTTAATGALGSSGYIEFWGEMNDGKMDTKLYREADYQLSDHWSLETDTAAYFLTVNTPGGNLRYTNAANNVAGNVLPAEPYFMNTRGAWYKNEINHGYAAVVGFYVYSSSYDIGEGWTTNDIAPGFNLFQTMDNLNINPAGPSATFKIAAVGNALNGRNLKVTFWNTTLVDEPMPYFSYIKKTVPNIPMSAFLSNDYLTFSVENTSSTTSDRMKVGYMELTYPSKFIFNNQKNFSFELPATVTGNFLVIDNFDYGTVAPVLLDLNNNKRYTGDISTAGKVKFALPASSDQQRKFILISQDVSNIKQASNLSQRNFVNYSLAANQANYLIISNTALFNNGAGQNYVDQYRAYRSSVAGGSFSAKVYDIDQLNDQFAYGIKAHPYSVKEFVQFIKTGFAQMPKYIFLIGKGVDYFEYNYYHTSVYADKLNLVPTFGYPASDVCLVSDYNSIIPEIPVGRLSVVNGNEVNNYLKKIIQYEAAQASPSQTVGDKAWMKKVVHVIGGGSADEDTLFRYYMDRYKDVIEDTLFGGNVETFSKSSNAAIQILAGQRIEELFNQGISLIGYFGHSSANTLAFNLNSPETYQNTGKYPFFNVSGCTAGNNYVYDSLRMSGILSLSEKYVLSDQKGSIGFLASTHLGIPPFLNNYNEDLYQQLGQVNYGNSIGSHIKNVIDKEGGRYSNLDYFTRMNLEEINLHGDPAIKINPFAKPDYVIEEPMIKINPTIVSVADNRFTININMLNIGRAINDSIRVTVKRTMPDATVITLFNKKIAAIKYSDSIIINSIINPIADKGSNKITVTLDADNNVDEISELNNTITKEFFIFEDEVRPVYPYNYSIMTQPNISYYGSTANPLTLQRQILLDVDTTELFNSPFKKSFNTNSIGGLIQFSPTITYTDSTVYYWRVAMQPLTGPTIYNNASFIYLANSSKGFNQSHYFQHLKSDYSQINLGANRKFDFNIVPRNLNIKTGLYPYFGYDQINVNIDFTNIENYGCRYHSLQFLVYDSSTLQPWTNFNVTPGVGRFGSANVCGGPRSIFEFGYNDASFRKRAMDFLDSIPAGKYVSITNLGYIVNTTFIDQWKADTATLGSGKSLYHKLKSIGFTTIDSFTSNKPFIFLYQKGVTTFAPKQVMGSAADVQLNESFILNSKYVNGSIESPKFGPAKAWKALHWRGNDVEASAPDSVQIEVYGINNAGTKTKLATVSPAKDTSLTFIDARTYPYISLKMLTSDPVFATPQQLSYWRVNADYVPEGAIAPNILFKMKDTVEVGEQINFSIAFKNISETAFDSLKLKFIITDASNVPHTIALPKKKALQSGDTLTVNYTIDTRNYGGMNTLFVEVNPDNDQPEQYHFNNFIYKNFFVKTDNYNPLLDVTFDGVHILNRDIVSARPHIVIKLKDESKFLALNDTSLVKVQVRYPDGTLKNYRFDNDTLKFTAANLVNGDNTATIDFSPYLPGEDDEYELLVSGKDVIGNKAGDLDYHVNFRVIGKPMISNLLNYPNPFTTSTAFVFTVTGSQPPQNLRIQILTITGKIVREITKDELGPIHVGRNITDFKWDGTDMYGQKLANGVYLYRVLTNLNGKKLDKFKDTDDGTDKYFTKGYGKMYFMR